jgi:aspartokinase/homoserine dehydrogenase 1
MPGIDGGTGSLISPINYGKKYRAVDEKLIIQDFVNAILDHNLPNSIFVDITANATVADTYAQLLSHSVSVVACNKIACSSAYAHYANLKALARMHNAAFLFETNVGASLPVISTLNDLIRSGDQVHRIEAVLSGTLNFVFNHYEGGKDGKSFAQVVQQAQDEGYSEPDPRLDLGGTDVMRKVMILAREAGHPLEMEDIVNNSFLPTECFNGSVADFYIERAKPPTILYQFVFFKGFTVIFGEDTC